MSLLFYGMALSLAAQEKAPAKIKGFVYSPCAEAAEKGQEKYDPLPFASVTWKGTNVGTVTDTNGFFRLETTDKTDTLEVSFVGFGTNTLIYAGQRMLEIVLIQGEELDEAKIEAERESVSISLLDPRVAQAISSSELSRDACCNLAESFETNATVDASFTDAV
ncbi:MAG: carboxypeptidase-like regulatory domain-containing protein, partial [Bacteroidota bacterium]